MLVQALVTAVNDDGNHVDGLDLEDVSLLEIGSIIERFTQHQQEKGTGAARIKVSFMLPSGSSE